MWKGSYLLLAANVKKTFYRNFNFSSIQLGQLREFGQQLVSVKKVEDGWEIIWRFTTRYMGHAPYSEIKLSAIDEHEMIVYMTKSGEIKKAICCGEYEVREWKKKFR